MTSTANNSFYKESFKQQAKGFEDCVSFSDETEPISYFSILPRDGKEIIRMTDIILGKSDKGSNYTDAKAVIVKKFKLKKTQKITPFNRSMMNGKEMHSLRKKIQKETKKKPAFFSRGSEYMKVKQLIRRTDHFCKNKSVGQFVNAWRLNIGYDSKTLEYNPHTNKLMIEFTLDIKYLFPVGTNFDTSLAAIRLFDFAIPTDPYYYGASCTPSKPFHDYAREYIKHKKAFSITCYQDTKIYKIKLEELTYNKEFADARLKSAFLFTQKLRDLNTPRALALADSINHTLSDLDEAYKYQRYLLKVNGIMIRTQIKA